MAVVVTPVLKKQGALADLQAQVDVAKKEAEKASDLHKEIERLTVAARFLEDKKSSSPSAINVLNELTKLLPNDTWLYQLELNGTEVVIHGETSASSTIIGLIEASPLFEKVTFRSPVTQNRSTGGERFNLSAQVVVEKKS
jgi:general secretion pathway protein L